ncbi:MAG TPA: GNAT family N-acetyltransferase [Myxococcaceae bacterium]|nr:GNAT family N-acetyltransferase [Myxococcaceae bacterium]
MLLRRLTLDDVSAGARLTAAAFGGPPREARLRRYLELEPEGWFAVEDGGTLVALGGAVRFGTLAWLGLMVVEPGHQRAGLGRTVARAAIDWAQDRGCTTIRLIATPVGTPLYRQLGFVPDGESQELTGVPRLLPPRTGRPAVHPWRARDTEEVAHFDAPAFGTERSRLLAAYAREFSGSAWVSRDDSEAVNGFLVVQEESIGPWCATDEQVAGHLLDVALTGVTRPLKAGVIDDVGARLLTARGLARVRPLPRMRLGPPVPHGVSPLLLAHASYALG